MKKKFRIIFTSHALNKITLLKQHGFIVSKIKIKDTLIEPDNLDALSDEPNFIASKDFDETHILRVVYKIENGIIKLITFYPAEKGRYY